MYLDIFIDSTMDNKISVQNILSIPPLRRPRPHQRGRGGRRET